MQGSNTSTAGVCECQAECEVGQLWHATIAAPRDKQQHLLFVNELLRFVNNQRVLPDDVLPFL